MILICTLTLLLGLFVIVLYSNYFVDEASNLAMQVKLPKMLIALTIAAFGTCAPEIAISFISIASGNVDMTFANVIGSCVVNILMIIGIATIIKPIKVKDITVKKELPLLLIITSAFFVLISDNLFNKNVLNGLSRADGIMLLCWFVVFILYILRIVRKNTKEIEEYEKKSILKSIIMIIVSLFVIVISSDLIVDSATILAEILNIEDKIISMVVIVIGTSLPELIMTVSAAKKGEFDIALGNIIGTNIFNMCVVLGLPIAIYGGVKSASFTLLDTFVVLLSSIIFFFFGRSNKELTRSEGIWMVLIFLFYYVYILL